jgi:hypothetical protein
MCKLQHNEHRQIEQNGRIIRKERENCCKNHEKILFQSEIKDKDSSFRVRAEHIVRNDLVKCLLNENYLT